MADQTDLEAEVVGRLQSAGARFGFVFGSRAGDEPGAESDLDVAGWWGENPPHSWEVDLPSGVDLVVLDHAPLWLAGRVALRGRILFDDNPGLRVAWQADTRLFYLDELPLLRQRQEEWLRRVTDGG